MTHLRILFLSFMSVLCASPLSSMEHEQPVAHDQVNNNVTLVVNGQDCTLTQEQAKKSVTIKHLIEDENTEQDAKIPVPVTCTDAAWELIQKFMREEAHDLTLISQEVLADTIKMVNFLDIPDFFEQCCEAFCRTISFEEFKNTPHYFEKFGFQSGFDKILAQKMLRKQSWKAFVIATKKDYAIKNIAPLSCEKNVCRGFFPKKNLIATLENNMAKIVDSNTGKVLSTFQVFDTVIEEIEAYVLQFSPKGTFLVISRLPQLGTVNQLPSTAVISKVFNVKTNECVHTFEDIISPCCPFNNDESKIALVCLKNKRATVYQTDTWKCIQEINTLPGDMCIPFFTEKYLFLCSSELSDYYEIETWKKQNKIEPLRTHFPCFMSLLEDSKNSKLFNFVIDKHKIQIFDLKKAGLTISKEIENVRSIASFCSLEDSFMIVEDQGNYFTLDINSCEKYKMNEIDSLIQEKLYSASITFHCSLVNDDQEMIICDTELKKMVLIDPMIYEFFKKTIKLHHVTLWDALVSHVKQIKNGTITERFDLTDLNLLEIFKTFPPQLQAQLLALDSIIIPEWYTSELSDKMTCSEMKVSYQIQQPSSRRLVEFLILKAAFGNEKLQEWFLPKDDKK